MRKQSTQALVGLLTVALVGMMTPALAGIIVTVGKTGPAASDTTDGPDRTGPMPCLDDEPDTPEPGTDPVTTHSGSTNLDSNAYGSDDAYPSDEEAAAMDCEPVGGGIMWCRGDERRTGASAGAAGGGVLADGDMVDVDGSGDLAALGCSGGSGHAPFALLLAVFGFLGLRVRSRSSC